MWSPTRAERRAGLGWGPSSLGWLGREFVLENSQEAGGIVKHVFLQTLGLFVDERVPQVGREHRVVVVAVLLEKGQDLLAEATCEVVRIRDRLIALQEEGVPHLLLAPLALDDPAVELLRELIESQVANLGPSQRLGIGHQFRESKPAAQRSIQKPDTAIRSVHRAHHVQIRWNRERMFALGQ